MNEIYKQFRELKSFIILWMTQSLSALGSSMTAFALIIWSYEQKGSALSTALLAVCSYIPYVLVSIFAGALSDRWDKRRTMLACDCFAAMSTVSVLLLLKTGHLLIWHLYIINALNGLMNTLQRPASEVATSLLTPPKHYQKVSGMLSFSNSLINVLTPIIASALLAFGKIDSVIIFDLVTFAIAFLTLFLFVRIPGIKREDAATKETVLTSAICGLSYLKKNRGILDLILFLSAINLSASIYNAALPAMLLSRQNGGETALGMVNACAGIAMLTGSLILSFSPAPKSRIRVIFNTLLFSMSTENILLSLGRTPLVWCSAAVLGWVFVPIMSGNMDVILRSKIPVSMQGRVYSARNSLQFFTIPIGYFLGGFLIDKLFEPFMADHAENQILTFLFGSQKGAGAAMLFMFLAVFGVVTCVYFRFDRHIWSLDQNDVETKSKLT